LTPTHGPAARSVLGASATDDGRRARRAYLKSRNQIGMIADIRVINGHMLLEMARARAARAASETPKNPGRSAEKRAHFGRSCG
jgi:hypothetical protein